MALETDCGDLVDHAWPATFRQAHAHDEEMRFAAET